MIERIKTMIVFLFIFLAFSFTGYLCYIDFRMQLFLKDLERIKNEYRKFKGN
ncbi:hypothetical protein [Campylobacter sp. MG1]|uniref:hypothetical protein n=1 Tax=Campylobacter sp. MG1 TaxID=2976332 RepID=UPI00226C7660|nr:hypothetical protein [Campylobacter sp. MG1]